MFTLIGSLNSVFLKNSALREAQKKNYIKVFSSCQIFFLSEAKKKCTLCIFRLVAEEGFEPPTFGL